MPATKPSTATAKVWRDFSQLAAEALAIGVVFSILVALAVMIMARDVRTDGPLTLDMTLDAGHGVQRMATTADNA